MNSIIQLIIFLYLQLMINMFEKCSHIFDNMSDHFDQELKLVTMRPIQGWSMRSKHLCGYLHDYIYL